MLAVSLPTVDRLSEEGGSPSGNTPGRARLVLSDRIASPGFREMRPHPLDDGSNKLVWWRCMWSTTRILELMKDYLNI